MQKSRYIMMFKTFLHPLAVEVIAFSAGHTIANRTLLPIPLRMTPKFWTVVNRQLVGNHVEYGNTLRHCSVNKCINLQQQLSGHKTIFGQSIKLTPFRSRVTCLKKNAALATEALIFQEMDAGDYLLNITQHFELEYIILYHNVFTSIWILLQSLAT